MIEIYKKIIIKSNKIFHLPKWIVSFIIIKICFVLQMANISATAPIKINITGNIVELKKLSNKIKLFIIKNF